MLAEDDQPAEAIAQLRLVLNDHPDYVPAMLQPALLSHAKGDGETARNALESVLEREPGHDRATAYLRMLEPKQASD